MKQTDMECEVDLAMIYGNLLLREIYSVFEIFQFA